MPRVVLPNFEGKKTKDLILRVLSEEFPLTAKKIFLKVRKEFLSPASFEAIYKALQELHNDKVIAKKDDEYSISLEWLNKISKLSERIRENYSNKSFQRKMFQTSVNSSLCSTCDSSTPTGFCLLCFESVCENCGEKIPLNNHGLGSKEVWIHNTDNCKSVKDLPNDEVVISVLEIQHDCWFSKLSEKFETKPILTTFSDTNDLENDTHSGKIEIDTRDKKVLEEIYKNKQIVQLKPIQISNNKMVLRTRAKITKSAEEVINKNNSVILNPVIADDGKERNIVISPNRKELLNLQKSLNEQGSCRIKKSYPLKMSRFSDIDRLYQEYSELGILKKEDILGAVKKLQMIKRINEFKGG